jgi:hypothetical protein
MAKKVTPLTNIRLSYDATCRLVACICQQQTLLLKYSYSFYGLCADDVLIVDDGDAFFVANSCWTHPVSKTGHLVFQSPFPRNPLFCSPELLDIRELPSESVTIKTFYFSVGALAFYALFKDKKEKEQNKTKEMEVKEIEVKEMEFKEIEVIFQTPLYWFLKRATDPCVATRSCIMI